MLTTHTLAIFAAVVIPAMAQTPKATSKEILHMA
jgi:hypothetical protein